MFSKSRTITGLALLILFALANVSFVGASTEAQQNSKTIIFAGYGEDDRREEAAFQAQMDAFDQLMAWVMANPGEVWVPVRQELVSEIPSWEAEFEIEILVLF